MDKNTPRRLRLLAACATAALTPVQLASAQTSVPSRTVVLTGVDDNLGPGLGPGITFTSLASASRIPTLAIDSRFAFAATIQGPGVASSNNSGVWVAGVDPPTLLVREGDPAPGPPAGVVFGPIISASINDTGRVVFRAQLLGLEPAGATLRGYFSIKDGTTRLIAYDGQTLLDTDGAQYQIATVDEPSFAGPNRVLFRAALGASPGGGSNDWALFEWTHDGISLLVRRHVHAPGFAANIEFASAVGPPASTTPNDRAAFQANVGVGGSSPLTSVIYASDAEDLAPFVIGGAAPGLPGVTFSPYDPVINDNSHVVFQALLSGASVPTSDTSALMFKSDAAPQFIARGGAGAQPAGHVFDSFDSVRLNNADSIAFIAETRVPPAVLASATSIWLNVSSGLHPLALEGDPAPGTASATVFERFTDVNLNNNSIVTFAAVAENASHALLPGIWAINRSGTLMHIASGDRPIELRPGDVRTPSFGAFAATTATSRPLNDANRMLYWCAFPDNAYALLEASVPAGCTADLNADGVTDGRDLSVLLAQFGQGVAPGSGADVNLDSAVDGRDLSVLLASYGCAP